MDSRSSQPIAKHIEPVLRAMFEARKRVFVDLLRWDVPVQGDRYEVDQFDDADATYLVLTDEAGSHRASTRLLRTDRPHILSELFAFLCDDRVPRGPTTREITRFCLEPKLPSPERRKVRNELVTALTDFALRSGITDYTGVASLGWFRQVMAFGWNCQALGPVQEVDGARLVALHIRIERNTPSLLTATGVYSPPTCHLAAGGLQ